MEVLLELRVIFKVEVKFEFRLTLELELLLLSACKIEWKEGRDEPIGTEGHLAMLSAPDLDLVWMTILGVEDPGRSFSLSERISLSARWCVLVSVVIMVLRRVLPSSLRLSRSVSVETSSIRPPLSSSSARTRCCNISILALREVTIASRDKF